MAIIKKSIVIYIINLIILSSIKIMKYLGINQRVFFKTNYGNQNKVFGNNGHMTANMHK